MTQKELRIIDTINREGIDNFEWGITDSILDTDHYGITPCDLAKENKVEELPPHIYIYGNTENTYGSAMEELLYKKYDRKFICEDDDTSFICFFWLDPKTL